MTLQTAPICGGIHLIFGFFVGGSDLNDGYYLKTKSPYKLPTRLNTPKQSSSSWKSLINAGLDLPKLKFHGKLETPADCVTEYDKGKFLQAVK